MPCRFISTLLLLCALPCGCDRAPPPDDGAPAASGVAPPPPGSTVPSNPRTEQGLAGLISAVDSERQGTQTVRSTISRPEHPDRLLFLGMEAPTSTSWQWQPPRSSAWLAQWIVPGPSGSEPAELVIWTPAESVQGVVDNALPTWEQQFRTGVLPAKARRETRTIGGMDVHMVELAGEYTGMGGGWHRPDHRQISAIIGGPTGTVIIRMLGPGATIEANRAAMVRMVEGLRRTP